MTVAIGATSWCSDIDCFRLLKSNLVGPVTMPDIMDLFDTHEEVAKKVLSLLLWHGPTFPNGVLRRATCPLACFACRIGYNVKAVNKRFNALVGAYAIDHTSGREHCACDNQCQKKWLSDGWICPVFWQQYSWTQILEW